MNRPDPRTPAQRARDDETLPEGRLHATFAGSDRSTLDDLTDEDRARRETVDTDEDSRVPLSTAMRDDRHRGTDRGPDSVALTGTGGRRDVADGANGTDLGAGLDTLVSDNADAHGKGDRFGGLPPAPRDSRR